MDMLQLCKFFLPNYDTISSDYDVSPSRRFSHATTHIIFSFAGVNHEQISPPDTFPVISQMMKEAGHIPQPNFTESPHSDSSDRPVRDVRRNFIESPHSDASYRPVRDVKQSAAENTDDNLSVCSDACSVNELFTTKPSKEPKRSVLMCQSYKPGPYVWQALIYRKTCI